MFGQVNLILLILIITSSTGLFDKYFIIQSENLVKGEILEYYFTNNLNECLRRCKIDDNCYGINFVYGIKEDTICLLMAKEGSQLGNDDHLPVESSVIYSGEVIFLKPKNVHFDLNTSWMYEKISNLDISHQSHILQIEPTYTLESCLILCYKNHLCLSAIFNKESLLCKLSRTSLYTSGMNTDFFYKNNNWDIYQKNYPKKILNKSSCNFQQYHNLWIGNSFIEKLVNISDVLSCESLCLQKEEYTCQSYTYEKTSKNCYLSQNLIRTVKKNKINNPLADIISGEVVNCMNFNIKCTSKGVMLRSLSSHIFTGNVTIKNNELDQNNLCSKRVSEKYILSIYYPFDKCNFIKKKDNYGYEYFNTFFIKEGSTKFITIRDKKLSIKCTFKNMPFKYLSKEMYSNDNIFIEENNSTGVKRLSLQQPVEQMFILTVHYNNGSIIDNINGHDNISIIISGNENFEVRDLKIIEISSQKKIQIIDEFGNIPSEIKNTTVFLTNNDNYKFILNISNALISKISQTQEIVIEALIYKNDMLKNLPYNRKQFHKSIDIALSKRNVNLEEELYYLRNNGKLFFINEVNYFKKNQSAIISAVLWNDIIIKIHKYIIGLFLILSIFFTMYYIIVKTSKYKDKFFFIYKRQVNEKDTEIERENVNE
uniref:Apple domain-containing protein n=1 Tax=Strongyloides stercoralis TaxID=6248 RepID=A0A0K0EJ96_STRER